MRTKHVKLPAVKSRIWLEREGWSYSPSKSKREVVHQRDGFWLVQTQPRRPTAGVRV